MRRAALVVAVALVALLPSLAFAEEGDSSTLVSRSLRIGDRSLLVLEVAVPPNATVEVDPAAPSWQGVEIVSIAKSTTIERAGQTVVHLELEVAPFTPGQQDFAPGVNVIEGTTVTPRQLPSVSWTVAPTLKPNDPLELSPLGAPSDIGGGESPLLRPGIGLGGAAAVAIAGTGLWFGGRRVVRSRRRPVPAASVEADVPDLSAAEDLLHYDPVTAYRALAVIVRGVIANEYGVPAHALTSSELRRRMESSGADRFRARLVGGFLEECDSVVYAGYRPAAERRVADLTMAREIVEGSA
jgi:hypothetical protein